MREIWGVLWLEVARWRNRAFWRHVITSGGRVLDTSGEVELVVGYCCAMVVKV